MFDLDGEVFFWNLCWPLPKGQEIVEQLIQVMQRIYWLSLFFFLCVYICLLSYLVIFKYNTLALEHQCCPGKS